MTKTDEDQELHPKQTKYDMSQPGDIISLINDEAVTLEELQKYLSAHIENLAAKHGLEKYRIVFLVDQHYSIDNYHSNKIYEALGETPPKEKNILMVLVSSGGKIEPAYLISKTCKRLTCDKFVVAVPRKAKSAATLISLGADEIHMGLLSELGPIDPQFGGFPALGLANALEKIANLSAKFPAASDMFAKYLTTNLNIRDLGYFERIMSQLLNTRSDYSTVRNFQTEKHLKI